MRKNSVLLLIAVALLALGAVTFALQPGPPDPVCVTADEPSSGWVDDDDPDCYISIESYARIKDHQASPKKFRLAGLALIIAGAGVAGAAVVSRSQRQAPSRKR